MSGTIYRCLGGHPDEIARLIARDRDGLTRGEVSEAGAHAPVAARELDTAGSNPAPGTTRDASETSIAAYVGGLPGNSVTAPIGEPARLLTEQDDGRWKALAECPKCGIQDGRIGPRSLCQALIDRHQFHVAACGGGRVA